ncbi:MAG: hypothetical protein WCP60_11315 [bacterium]
MVLRELEVRAAKPEEMGRVRETLVDEHYLGAGRAGARWCKSYITGKDG